jgi:CubicO group peptidase (beta-lactamase class C family)
MERIRITRRRALGILGAGAAVAAALPLYRVVAPSEPRPLRPASFDDTVVKRLQHLYDDVSARPELHQAIVVVETGAGAQRWVGAPPDRRRSTPTLDANTPVVLASITKLYTAALVLRLAERGRLRLDEPIANLLPGSLIAGLHRRDGVDRTGEITIRHLLAHSSGLADYFTDRPRGGLSLGEQIAEADMAWTPSEMIERVRTELSPHFPPQPAGTVRQKIRYSDTNYLLLRMIVEEVEVGSLIEVMRRELLEPLGLRRTTAYPTGTPTGTHGTIAAAGIADGGFTDGTIDEPAPLWIGDKRWDMPLALGSFGADGAMIAPLGETIAFMRALIRGQSFDDPAIFDLMHARWNRFGLPLDRSAIQLPNWPIEYGLGMMRFQLPSLMNGLQRMPPVVGHTGSIGSWLFYCPELDLLTAGTFNQATASALPYSFVPKLLRAFT